VKLENNNNVNYNSNNIKQITLTESNAKHFGIAPLINNNPFSSTQYWVKVDFDSIDNNWKGKNIYYISGFNFRCGTPAEIPGMLYDSSDNPRGCFKGCGANQSPYGDSYSTNCIS
jgi:hypothetical protein